MKDCDIELRDYLSPGGKYPYNQLFRDMQAAFDAGRAVYVWSVPGFMIAAGHPDDTSGYPWSDGRGGWYATPRDCINMENRQRESDIIA